MCAWRSRNKDKVSDNNRRWYANGGSELKKVYDDHHRTAHRQREHERDLSDIQFRMKKVMRTRINKVLRGVTKSGRSVELLGCSMEFYMNWIGHQFEGTTNWSNYGTVWNIDHVRPCSSFDLTRDEEQFHCFRPLPTSVNYAKNAKVDFTAIIEHRKTVEKFLSSFEAVPRTD